MKDISKSSDFISSSKILLTFPQNISLKQTFYNDSIKLKYFYSEILSAFTLRGTSCFETKNRKTNSKNKLLKIRIADPNTILLRILSCQEIHPFGFHFLKVNSIPTKSHTVKALHLKLLTALLIRSN